MRGKDMSVANDKKQIASILEEMEDIRRNVQEITYKLDLLLERQDLFGMMRLSERSLSAFLNEEPDLYSVADCRVVYR